MSQYEYNTVDEFIAAVESGVADACEDNPEINPDDAFADLVASMIGWADPALWQEIHRCTGTQSRTEDYDDWLA